MILSVFILVDGNAVIKRSGNVCMWCLQSQKSLLISIIESSSCAPHVFLALLCKSSGMPRQVGTSALDTSSRECAVRVCFACAHMVRIFCLAIELIQLKAKLSEKSSNLHLVSCLHHRSTLFPNSCSFLYRLRPINHTITPA